jgi:hypothetical protein
MTRTSRSAGALALVTLFALAASTPACERPAPKVAGESARAEGARSAPPSAPLSFTIKEGNIENRFFRDGQVAAHLLATSGEAPRLVVAFPAGNMGIGVWFDGKAELVVDGELGAVLRRDGMRGVTATLRARAPELRVKRALLSSIRVLRDSGRDGPVPPGLEYEIVAGPPVVLRRTTMDGQHHLELALEPRNGTVAKVEPNGDLSFSAGDAREIAFGVTALADDEPLTPVPPDRLVARPVADRRALEVLSFLTYEEKLLAGSWQYLTYFGRDTLLSTRLLMPVLKPTAIEAALGSVIERLSTQGEVAHEEDIGEWAVSENLARSPRPTDLSQPIYDYKMVDDDFMLAPILAAYVLDTPAGRERAAELFNRRTSSGRSYADAVRKNLERVVVRAAPFGARPGRETLIHLEKGTQVGNWRDSEEGLGRGRVPYDVNGALVPAALRAAERLYATEAFGKDTSSSTRAAELARAWGGAEALFRVQIDADEARRRIATYAAEQKIDAKEALEAITGPVSFPAVALDAKGAPLPIQHSDDGFVLLFTEPSAEWLAGAADRVLLPFPAGLRTPVGVVVANPAYAPDPALRALFTRDHYHGTVIWSWQQAMLLSGLRRQLARTDLPQDTLRKLGDAEQALMRAIDGAKSMRTSEMWSFAVEAGEYRVVPFGQGSGHHTEANAAQLWSTVYLALDGAPPRAGAARSTRVEHHSLHGAARLNAP